MASVLSLWPFCQEESLWPSKLSCTIRVIIGQHYLWSATVQTHVYMIALVLPWHTTTSRTWKSPVIWNCSLHPEAPFETEQGVVSSVGAPHSLLHVWIVACGRAFTRWSFSSCLRGSLYASVALTHHRSDPDSHHELWAFVVAAEYV